MMSNGFNCNKIVSMKDSVLYDNSILDIIYITDYLILDIIYITDYLI